MIDFLKDNNVGLPAKAFLIHVKTDSTTVMQQLLNDGFEEVLDARKLRHRTFFLIRADQVIVYRRIIGYQVFQTLGFSGARRG